MEMNEESILAWNIIEKTSANLFLTGKAGTGKTTFLKQLKEKSPKRMVVLAPTGIAAINAGGMTIHSFFQLPFSPYIPGTTFGSGEQKRYQFSKLKRNIIRSIDLLVIDEISMVRSDLLDAIDSVLRQYRKRHDLPFGGVQLLMIGDLQQLAPVVTAQEEQLLKEHYDTPFFFSSNALKQVGYLTVELKKVYRQQDEQFISLLNQIRENRASDATLQALNQRFIPNFEPPKNSNFIRLTTHNAPAQYINEQQLAALPSRAFSYTAEVEDNFPESSYPADFVLTLKPGAQVMFIKNDPQHRFYNGMIGEVIGVKPDEEGDKIIVRSKDSDEEFELEKMEWVNAKYTINEETKEIEETVEGKFRQYPLRLAWAITIHKSQGLTFEHAIIDASHSFTHGQTYVALSRCKTLEGMVLSQPLSRGAIISSQTVDVFNSQLAAPTQEQISYLEQQYVLHCIGELFDFYAISGSYEHLMRCLVEYFNSKYPRVVSEYQKLQVVLKSLIGVSDKFRLQYTRMLSQNPDILQAELQERIHKGAEYFFDKIGILSDLIKKSNLDTDNKVAKKQFQDRFSVFSEDVKLKERLLKYERSAVFTVTDYLKKKAQFMLLDEMGEGASSSAGYASGRKARKQKKSNEPKEPKIPTKEVSFNLYQQGMTVDQIAAERGFTKGTIIGHLTSYVKEGKVGLRALISSAHEKKIREFMEAHPEMEHFSEIKEALGAGIDYYEIKLIRDLMEEE
ncbi:MAG: helix-turn-helix domain-containing protein [Prevotella sp.]|nr:helix-turn-helix domain-containing protein [Prevotella sp.]